MLDLLVKIGIRASNQFFTQSLWSQMTVLAEQLSGKKILASDHRAFSPSVQSQLAYTSINLNFGFIGTVQWEVSQLAFFDVSSLTMAQSFPPGTF